MMTQPQLNLRYIIRHESRSGKETLEEHFELKFDLMLITMLYQLQLLFSLDWLEIAIIHGEDRERSGCSLFPCCTPVCSGWRRYRKPQGICCLGWAFYRKTSECKSAALALSLVCAVFQINMPFFLSLENELLNLKKRHEESTTFEKH
jgi:hypothetical protein